MFISGIACFYETLNNAWLYNVYVYPVQLDVMHESVLSFGPWFTYFQIAGKYYKSLKTNPLKIIVGDFGLWWPGDRIDFSCLYIPY